MGIALHRVAHSKSVMLYRLISVSIDFRKRMNAFTLAVR
jgi:hypothetical protein